MANASLDNNGIPTVLGALNTDGITPVKVKAHVSTHGLHTDQGTTGTDHGTVSAVRDENRKTVWMGVSSADGITPVEIYADSDGNLLTQII